MAKKSFEDNLQRLEEIAELMESEETTLEGSLKLYKEGIDLCIKLGEKLEDISQQVSLLKKSAEGVFEKKPFDASEDYDGI